MSDLGERATQVDEEVVVVALSVEGLWSDVVDVVVWITACPE